MYIEKTYRKKEMPTEVLQSRRTSYLKYLCYSLKYYWPLWLECEIFQWFVEDFSGLGPADHRLKSNPGKYGIDYSGAVLVTSNV